MEQESGGCQENTENMGRGKREMDCEREETGKSKVHGERGEKITIKHFINFIFIFSLS